MKRPFPFNILFPRKTTSGIMAEFTAKITELRDHASSEFALAEKTANKAEKIFDVATAQAEESRTAAEAAYVAKLAKIDEQEEAEVQKADALEAEWDAHVNECDAALAAANGLSNALGLGGDV